LPKALTKENKTKLCQSEGDEVNEDYYPICKLEQKIAQDEGTGPTDDQIEDSVVNKPGNPVGCLG